LLPSQDGPSQVRANNHATGGENDKPSPSNENGNGHCKKKEKKEAKRLERAANREKVTTMQDYEYLDGILHPPVDNRSAIEAAANLDEVQERENRLRQAAELYVNQMAPLPRIQGKGKSQAGDIDWGNEIGRIFDALGITPLIRKNEKNRGLRGNDLKRFNKLVSKLTDYLIEDFVQIKRDEMEVDMRREAFCRYAGIQAYHTLLQRYGPDGEGRDWATGLITKREDKFEESTGPVTPPDGVTEQASYHVKRSSEGPKPTHQQMATKTVPGPVVASVSVTLNGRTPKKPLTPVFVFCVPKKPTKDVPHTSPEREAVLDPEDEKTATDQVDVQQSCPTTGASKREKKKKREAMRKQRRQEEREQAERDNHIKANTNEGATEEA
jgi:hypothetical protein